MGEVKTTIPPQSQSVVSDQELNSKSQARNDQ
jgi:hypothetical protein